MKCSRFLAITLLVTIVMVLITKFLHSWWVMFEMLTKLGYQRI